ncbi:hypothetical protein HK102_003220 [Quaeritorhiza haematococci]|nr:hypothetical protein HK102_003220 [Quaeritorhiza haematococci]
MVNVILESGVDVTSSLSTDALLVAFRNGYLEAVRAIVHGGISFGTHFENIKRVVCPLLENQKIPDETCETLLTVLISAFPPSDPGWFEVLQRGYCSSFSGDVRKRRIGARRLLLKTLNCKLDLGIGMSLFLDSLMQGNLDLCDELLDLGPDRYKFEIIGLVEVALNKSNDKSDKPADVFTRGVNKQPGSTLPCLSDMRAIPLSSSVPSASSLTTAALNGTESASDIPKQSILSPNQNNASLPNAQTSPVIAALEKIPKKTREAFGFLMDEARGEEGGWEVVRDMITHAAKGGFVDVLRILIEQGPSLLSDQYNCFGPLLFREEQPKKGNVASTQTPANEAPKSEGTSSANGVSPPPQHLKTLPPSIQFCLNQHPKPRRHYSSIYAN